MGARRRRAFLMLALALACGGLAASEVGGRVREVERRVGAPVPVVIAARDMPPDTKLKREHLVVRQVPERYAAPDSLSDPGQAVGARTAVPLVSGAQLTESHLGEGRAARARGGGEPGGVLRRGERAVEVAVSGGAALGGADGPGARVDVLVSTESRDGPGRSFLALEDVELLGLRAGGDEGAPEPGGQQAGAATATSKATLRVTLRQAVYLTAAQNFAREVRLLSRPRSDSRRSGRTVVDAGSL